MLSYIACNIPQHRLGVDGMHDIILLIAVFAYMIGGYFLVEKICEFFDENYKGFNCDNEEKTVTRNRENIIYPLRKK